MVKKALLLLTFFLASCSSLPVLNLGASNENLTQENPACTEFNHFLVFQVLPDSKGALAKAGESKDLEYCYGAVVFLTSKTGLDYYDDMRVSVPKDKCAVQKGTYRYITKSDVTKTVPRIEWGCQYIPKNNDVLAQLEDYLQYRESVCNKISAKNPKVNQASVSKYCDCLFDEFNQEYRSQIENGKRDVLKNEKAKSTMMNKIQKNR